MNGTRIIFSGLLQKKTKTNMNTKTKTKSASVLRTLGAFGTKRLRRLTPSASRAEARSAFGASRLRRLSQVGFGISIWTWIEIDFRKESACGGCVKQCLFLYEIQITKPWKKNCGFFLTASEYSFWIFLPDTPYWWRAYEYAHAHAHDHAIFGYSSSTKHLSHYPI